MNGKSVLLDTNIIVEHFRPPSKYQVEMEAHRLYVPQIVVAELYAGALRSQRPNHHKQVADAFLESTTLVPTDLETAQLYAEIWTQLTNKGKMIPHNDIWIACLALQNGMSLITNDKHFGYIDGLKCVTW